jgi:hypothetical protein
LVDSHFFQLLKISHSDKKTIFYLRIFHNDCHPLTYNIFSARIPTTGQNGLNLLQEKPMKQIQKTATKKISGTCWLLIR